MEAQTTQLPNDMGFFMYEPSAEAVINMKARLAAYDPLDLDEISLLGYYLTSSSIELYSGGDTSLELFEKAYAENEYVTCRIMTGFHSSYSSDINSGQREEDFSWYLWDLPNFDEEEFINECNGILGISKVVQSRDTSVIEKMITYRDQQYRSLRRDIEVDYFSQGQLDLKNRWFIDSIYTTSPDLSSFSTYELDAFYLVVHHSGDCDWVYKWILRLMDNMKLHNDLYVPNIVGPMLDRMLDLQNGYCTSISKSTRDRFIMIARDRYPSIYDQLRFSDLDRE
jgi:hypothetical protein